MARETNLGGAAEISHERLRSGVWRGAGLLGPEAFDPDPFVGLMPEHRFPWGLTEMTA